MRDHYVTWDMDYLEAAPDLEFEELDLSDKVVEARAGGTARAHDVVGNHVIGKIKHQASLQ